MAAVPVSPPRHQNSAKIVQIMAKHPELCCFIVAVLLTIFSRYARSASKPITTAQPPPQHFFKGSSPVLDFPHGNLMEAAGLLTDTQTIFVFYYAPWDAKSLQARAEFEKAAVYLRFQVPFVAINCWYPLGACKKQNNFMSFPVLIFYHTTLDGFRYTGVVTAENLVKFVEKLLYPFTPVSTQDQVKDLLTTTDNALVGYFDFHASPQPPGFLQFYYAAMRIVEKDLDNLAEVGLISSSKLAKQLDITQSPSVFLISSHQNIKMYPESGNFTSSAIVQWFMTNKSEMAVTWLAPTGMKSLHLFTEFIKGPALVMFTPNYPTSHINQNFHMLREVALDYYNCDRSRDTARVILSSIQYQIRNIKKQMDILERFRHRVSNRQLGRLAIRLSRCCKSVLASSHIRANHSCICDVCLQHRVGFQPVSSEMCSDHHLKSDSVKCVARNHKLECQHSLNSHNPTQVLETCCYHNSTANEHQREVPPFDHPDPYIKSRVHPDIDYECYDMMSRRKNGWLPAPSLPDVITRTESLTGMGCQTNRSLHFYAINSRLQHMFVHRQGLELGQHPSNHSAVLIVDAENEVQYLMEEEINKENIVKFIRNFTSSELERYFVSVPSKSSPCVYSGNEACVIELNTSTFHQVVMQEDKDVVVLYYAPWCGFCASFAHFYLTLAAYFYDSPNITFARFNGDLHELPWELTVDAYPTILFFPAYSKDDSIAFPDHVPNTLPNLIQFILKYANRPLKLEKGLKICGKTCIKHNRQSSGNRIRTLYLNIRNLHQRAAVVARQVEELKKSESVKEDKLAILNQYEMLLQKRIKYNQLQLRSARQLHKVLVSSLGYFLKVHQVAAILDRFEVQQAKLERMHRDTWLEEDTEWEEESLDEESHHDEL